ncbi:MAG: aminoacyl-tRNA hydrolase [Actinobacteria bacterium]|nr:aminoacyl-tRNA hydrolase [Actinomycetota bacterium]
MDDLRVNRKLTIPAAELEVRVARGSGPGGQGVNTTDSKVELRFDVTNSGVLSDKQRRAIRKHLSNRLTKDGVLLVQAAERRSQHRNREDARRRLRDLLREALRPRKRRIATRPSRAADERRLQEKKHRGRIKDLRKPPESS